jgi:3'(2'), 5'-bisphosphate nucleotidase
MFDRFNELRDLARSAGWGAADILKSAEQSFQIEKSGESPVTSADLAANQHILDRLQTALSSTSDLANFAYLSEETHEHQPPAERAGRDWTWVIDPLDGTKDFIQHTGDYATHIALVYQGRPVVAVVACPARGLLYSAVQGQGTWVETKGGDRTRIQVSTTANPQEMVLLTSRNHRSEALANLLAQLPHKIQKPVGSIGGKIATIVAQQADIYVSLSGKSAPKDWDFAAPDLILTEAGGTITRFDGTPLTYNNPDVNQWGGILGSNGVCHDQLCATASQIMASTAVG